MIKCVKKNHFRAFNAHNYFFAFAMKFKIVEPIYFPSIMSYFPVRKFQKETLKSKLLAKILFLYTKQKLPWIDAGPWRIASFAQFLDPLTKNLKTFKKNKNCNKKKRFFWYEIIDCQNMLYLIYF